MSRARSNKENRPKRPSTLGLLLGGTGEEIASNLYDMLLKGEKAADIIIAVDMPREDGVYLGITNRLRKACG